MTPTGRRASVRLGRSVFAAIVVVSLVVLFAPADDVPGAPPGVDKIVHALLFLALAATGRWAGLRPARLGAALLAYAAVSEVLQGLPVISRTASVLDWVADAVGVMAGLALWARLAGTARR